MPPELLQCWDVSDDWTGVTDPRERRRRQNRLHQRIYRQKKNSRRRKIDESTIMSFYSMNTLANGAGNSYGTGAPQFDTATYMATFFLLRNTEVSEKAARFLQAAYMNWSIGRPMRSDLSTLSRLNAFDALAQNAVILQIPVECLASDDDESPFFHRCKDDLPSYPAHLSPTDLQITVRHHPWLDLLPFPKLRDNILTNLQANTIDEDELAHEIVCELLNFSGADTAPLIVWGDSWDLAGWECQADFLKRWPFLLDGCEEMKEASDQWKNNREAELLECLET